MAAEPKGDGDRLGYISKVADHLGRSNLEEKLNDFLELHVEELRSELRDLDGRHKEEYGLRVHQIYMDFLGLLQSNLKEFLQQEGLTEDELRAALEEEMLNGEAGGVSFMSALVCSWEFSSFLELVSEFMDESDGEEHIQPPAIPSSSTAILNRGECCCKSSRDRDDIVVNCGITSNERNVPGKLLLEKHDDTLERNEDATGNTAMVGVGLDEHHRRVSPGSGGNHGSDHRVYSAASSHGLQKHNGVNGHDHDRCGHRMEQEQEGDRDEPSMMAQSKS